MHYIRTAFDLEAALVEAAKRASELEDADEDKGFGENVATEKVTRKEKKRIKDSERRRKKRLLDAKESGLQAKKVALKHRKRMVETREFTSVNVLVQDLKVAKGSWLGPQEKKRDENESDVQHLLDRGFRLIKWDGQKAHAILDKSGRVVVVLAGMPSGSFQQDVIANVTAAFQEESEALSSPENTNAGDKFHAFSVGFSHGGGTKRPMRTLIQGIYQYAARRLVRHPAVFRLAGFQNQAFETYFPETHAYCLTTMGQIKRKDPSLESPLVDTFPSATFNMGLETVYAPHADSKNLMFGICVITALGQFDPKSGGHLVLEELGIVAEFPAGSTVLIPSAAIAHSNTKIQKGERRFSFMQHAPGELFSYVENSMRANMTIPEEGSKREKEVWKTMLPLFASY